MADYIPTTPSLRATFFKAVSGLFLLKLYNTGLAFLISLVLARTLHASGYGIYVYVIAWLNIFSLPVVFGMDKIIVRRISILSAEKRWSDIAGLQQRAMIFVVLTSSGTALGAWVLLRYTALSQIIKNAEILSVVFFILIPITMIRISQATLQGFHHVVLAQVSEKLVQPTLLILLLGLAILPGIVSLDPSGALYLYLGSMIGALVVGLILLRRKLPYDHRHIKPRFKSRSWLKGAFPLMVTAGFGTLNSYTDIVMLGSLSSAEETGFYHVASRFSGLLTFALLAVNASLSPMIARLHAVNELRRLQRALIRAARGALAISVVLAIINILLGEWLLSLFGSEFKAGYLTLIVLTIAQLGNVAAGSVAAVLTMTGHARDAALGLGVGVLVNIILNAVLIPVWGGTGAAVATGTAMLLWNIILLSRVRARLGITTTAFSRIDA